MLNRRSFMKVIGVSAIGSITTASLGTGEDSIEDRVDVRTFADKIINGQIYEAPYPLCHRVIVLYMGRGDVYVLLWHGKSGHWHNVLNVCHYDRQCGGYSPIYTQAELQDKLKTWKLIDAHVEIIEREAQGGV